LLSLAVLFFVIAYWASLVAGINTSLLAIRCACLWISFCLEVIAVQVARQGRKTLRAGFAGCLFPVLGSIHPGRQWISD
jgi:hypothetical protein